MKVTLSLSSELGRWRQEDAVSIFSLSWSIISPFVMAEWRRANLAESEEQEGGRGEREETREAKK